MSHFSITVALVLAGLASGDDAWAQNNTGYPPGTDCQDLQGQRSAACRDALDPRPNPREIINQPQQKAILPKAPRRLNQPVPKSDPYRQHNLPHHWRPGDPDR